MTATLRKVRYQRRYAQPLTSADVEVLRRDGLYELAVIAEKHIARREKRQQRWYRRLKRWLS